MSTATLAIRREYPFHRQMNALADRQVYVDETVPQRLGTKRWRSGRVVVDDTNVDFADMIPLNFAPIYDTGYWPVVTACWPLEEGYDHAVFRRDPPNLFRERPQPREEELLDWDVTIRTLSARPSTTIFASIEYRGRAKPRPVLDPWD